MRTSCWTSWFGWLAAAVAALACGVAEAQWRPDQVFAEAGVSARSTTAVGIGAQWAWQRDWVDGRLTGATELALSHWRAEFGDSHESRIQLVALPLLRYRPGSADSPWFVEGGIGLSLNNRRYRAHGAQMGSVWNFEDVLAAGRSFGPQGRHALSLRLVHISNAGLKKPNPGEQFILLRYAVAL